MDMREILWRTARTVNAVINRGNVDRRGEYPTNWADLPGPHPDTRLERRR